MAAKKSTKIETRKSVMVVMSPENIEKARRELVALDAQAREIAEHVAMDAMEIDDLADLRAKTFLRGACLDHPDGVPEMQEMLAIRTLKLALRYVENRLRVKSEARRKESALRLVSGG